MLLVDAIQQDAIPMSWPPGERADQFLVAPEIPESHTYPVVTDLLMWWVLGYPATRYAKLETARRAARALWAELHP